MIKVVKATRVQGPDGKEVFEVRCPFCGKWHQHFPEEGYRVTHCGTIEKPRRYFIIERMTQR